MRDPAGNKQRYEDGFIFDVEVAKSRGAGEAARTLAQKVKVASNVSAAIQKTLVRQYGYGLPLEQVAELAASGVVQLGERTRFIREHGPEFSETWASFARLRRTIGPAWVSPRSR